MKLSCINLLPQSPDAIVGNSNMRDLITKALSFLVGQLIESLYYFYLTNEYHLFDPHVGDTACQIRAYQLLLLIKDNKPNPNPLKRIRFLRNIKQCLTQEKILNQTQHYPNHQLTLNEFIQKLDVNFHLTETEWLLLRMYFLTRFKTTSSQNAIVINHDLIAKESTFSRKFAKKLTRYYQISLAQSSCKDILECSKNTEHTHPDEHLVLNASCRFDNDDRPVLPCYLFTKILYQDIRHRTFPIVMTVYKKNQKKHPPLTILFNHEKDNGMLIETFDKNYSTDPFIMITGEYLSDDNENNTDYLKRINSIGLENIVLSNMAIHPQYSGTRLATYKDSPFDGIQLRSNSQMNILEKERQQFKALANKIGCSRENPSLFVVNHIYCDHLAHHVNTLDTNIQKISTTNTLPDMTTLLVE